MKVLPNGETLEQFKERNLNWWQASRGTADEFRQKYYENFVIGMEMPIEEMKTKKVIEIGPGAFGGILIQYFDKDVAYADIFMEDLKNFEFVNWPENSKYYTTPMEDMSIIPDKEFDYLVSYNALDHGWDIYKSLDECMRISEHGYIAFDCKANTAPPHDRIDHYQEVWYDRLAKYVIEKYPNAVFGKLSSNFVENFKFEHNWGFPVMYIKY